MLMGIAAKNSILLVDYIIIAEDEGRPRLEAIMDAAHKRARPILMTTFAMGAGMLPIAIGLGAEVEFRQPMAIAVVKRVRLTDPFGVGYSHQKASADKKKPAGANPGRPFDQSGLLMIST